MQSFLSMLLWQDYHKMSKNSMGGKMDFYTRIGICYWILFGITSILILVASRWSCTPKEYRILLLTEFMLLPMVLTLGHYTLTLFGLGRFTLLCLPILTFFTTLFIALVRKRISAITETPAATPLEKNY
jgi:hypothetical protein